MRSYSKNLLMRNWSIVSVLNINNLNPPVTLPGLTVADVFSKILGNILGLFAIVFVGVLVYGGFKYMTAGGDPNKVKSAQGIILNGIIGMSVILLAFVIKTLLANVLGVAF